MQYRLPSMNRMFDYHEKKTQWKTHPTVWLSFISVAIYLLIVTNKLTLFPIYFFCDEVIPGVDAASLLATGYDTNGAAWPLFFRGLGDYALSLTVYLQLSFIYFIGLSQETIRLCTALTSVCGVIAAMHLFKGLQVANPRWVVASLVPLIFIASPFWYLHSRTGFEYIPSAAFYLVFLTAYLQSFRTKSWKSAILAGAAGAASFYSYTPARGWVLLSLVLFFISAPRTHFKNLPSTITAWSTFGALILPAAIITIISPERALQRFYSVGLHDFSFLTLTDKFYHIAVETAQALDPRIWFTWEHSLHSDANARHVVPTLPLIPTWLLPCMIIGFFTTLFRMRQFHNRWLIAAWVSGVFPAVLVQISTARCLIVGCLYLIFSVIGIAEIISQLSRRKLGTAIYFLLFGLSFISAISLHRFALKEAPLLYHDYGFYGVQYSATRVYDWIQKNLSKDAKVWVDSALFNAGEVYPKFYLSKDEQTQTQIIDISELCSNEEDVTAEGIFIAYRTRFEELDQKNCPLQRHLVQSILDPRGIEHIQIVTISRLSGFSEWLRGEREKRMLPVSSSVNVHGASLVVIHSPIDMGSIAQLFDNNPNTIARSAHINPARYEIRIPEQTLREVVVTFNNTTTAFVELSVEHEGKPVETATGRYSRFESKSHEVRMRLAKDTLSDLIRIRVTLTDHNEKGAVHLADISWH